MCCLSCAKADWCEQADRVEDFCINHEERPETNADRIRAMTDEELATFLFNNVSCSDCTMHGGGCSVDCEKWMLSWLTAPVEVDNG